MRASISISTNCRYVKAGVDAKPSFETAAGCAFMVRRGSGMLMLPIQYLAGGPYTTGFQAETARFAGDRYRGARSGRRFFQPNRFQERFGGI